jgi:RNA-binding protein YlmH
MAGYMDGAGTAGDPRLVIRLTMAYASEDGADARLLELCLRSARLQTPVCTRFLTPPEAELARRAARGQHVECTLSGGFPSAEREMACFHPAGEEPVFPIRCLHIAWDGRYHQAEHRSLLGSVLGLGIERSMIGDICLVKDGAYLLAAEEMADFIAQNLTQAGKTPVQAKVLNSIPPIEPPEGKIFRDTVASLRLDAVLAAGLSMSRSEAAAHIGSGQVQVNHRTEIRTDAQLHEGDLLSIRGFGRLHIKAVGMPTRKGRIPVQFESHGIHKS